MDNVWWAVKRKKGFYLYGSEVGQVGDACETICEALNSDLNQYSGGRVQIETNVSLEELLEIMYTQAFEPLLHNTDHLTINGVDIDADAIQGMASWYAEIRKNPSRGIYRIMPDPALLHANPPPNMRKFPPG